MSDFVYEKNNFTFLYTPYIKLYGMLVSEQFLFWLYLQNWAGAALWKFLYLKMA